MVFHTGLTGTPMVGVLFCYIREDIPSKFHKIRSDCNIEPICVEENLRKGKRLINSSYNLSKTSNQAIALLMNKQNVSKIPVFG